MNTLAAVAALIFVCEAGLVQGLKPPFGFVEPPNKSSGTYDRVSVAVHNISNDTNLLARSDWIYSRLFECGSHNKDSGVSTCEGRIHFWSKILKKKGIWLTNILVSNLASCGNIVSCVLDLSRGIPRIHNDYLGDPRFTGNLWRPYGPYSDPWAVSRTELFPRERDGGHGGFMLISTNPNESECKDGDYGCRQRAYERAGIVSQFEDLNEKEKREVVGGWMATILMLVWLAYRYYRWDQASLKTDDDERNRR